MKFWKIMRVLTTNQCNYRCSYCHNEGQEMVETPKFLKFEDFEKIMLQVIKTPINEIRFSGGEPLINKETLKMIEWVDKNTDLEVGLATNGSLIDEKTAKRLSKTRVLITLHLPGIKESDYKKVTQREWEPFEKAVSLLDKYSIDYSYNYVLSPKSFDNLDEVLKYVQNHKKRIKLLPYIEDNFLNLSEMLATKVNSKLENISFEKKVDNHSGITWWKLKNGGEVKLLDTPCYSKNIKTCKNYGEIRLLPNLKLQRCIFDLKTIEIDNLENIVDTLTKVWNNFNKCYMSEEK